MNKEERNRIVAELLEKYPIKEQVSFNEFDITEKIAKNAELYYFYYDLWLAEKAELEDLERKKERLECIIYDELRFPNDNSPHAFKRLDKREIIQFYIPRDKRHIKLTDMINRQKVIVEFFELAVKALDKQQWNMKKFIDSEKS